MTQTNMPRDEVEAALLTRRELGAEYEPAIADSLADRIDQIVAYRLANERQHQAPQPAPAPGRSPSPNAHANRSLALGIVSVVAAMPITVAGVSESGNALVVFMAFVCLVLINLVYAVGGRR